MTPLQLSFLQSSLYQPITPLTCPFHCFYFDFQSQSVFIVLPLIVAGYESAFFSKILLGRFLNLLILFCLSNGYYDLKGSANPVGSSISLFSGMFIFSTYLYPPSQMFSCFSVFLLPSHFLAATTVANRKFVRQNCILVGCVPIDRLTVSRVGRPPHQGDPSSLLKKKTPPDEGDPPPHGENDTRLWKHYLRHTAYTVGKYRQCFQLLTKI